MPENRITIDVNSFLRGAQESPSKTTLPEYDPKCYLCPGNTRATGDAMPQYKSTFIFVNDYSAVKEDQPDYSTAASESDGSSSRAPYVTVNPH